MCYILLLGGEMLSYAKEATLLETGPSSTPPCSSHRAEGTVVPLYFSIFLCKALPHIHSPRMQSLLSMPGTIFITKVHMKQAPSRCSKEQAVADAHRDISLLLGEGSATKHLVSWDV